MESSNVCRVIVLNVCNKHVVQQTKRTIYLHKCRFPNVTPTNDNEIIYGGDSDATLLRNPLSDDTTVTSLSDDVTSSAKDNLILDNVDNCDLSSFKGDTVLLRWALDPLLVACLTNEIYNSRHFRTNFCRNVLEGSRSQLITLNMRCKKKSSLSCIIEADLRWCYHMLPYLTMRLEFEDAFSWLSTLGGAYSSLGDQFHHCASIAGKISQQQFSLAYKLGDPYLVARCHVFLSLSLMQRGFLKHAQVILRNQFDFATQQQEVADAKLVAMCKGAWCKLQYLYHVKKQRRK